MTYTIAVLIGSLRASSWNRKLAHALAGLAPSELAFRFVEIGDLPFMNEDLEAQPPAEWLRFREEISTSDAVLFVTAEYNRSVPGVLKNAIDVGSRPYGKSVFDGKAAAVISGSIGPIGGFGANHHLRQSLAFLNMRTMPAEAYIGLAQERFDREGHLRDEATRNILGDFARKFATWVSEVDGQHKHAA